MTVMRQTLERKVKLVLLFGEDAELMRQAWRGSTRIEPVADMAAAVKRAFAAAQSGDCVLLAPACASFDMYDRFEQRGDDFTRRVRELVDV